MNKLIFTTFILISLLSACNNDQNLPPCPSFTDADLVDQIKSKELGSVIINGEHCKIFEQYRSYDCKIHDGEHYSPYTTNDPICRGITYHCNWEILTRTTVCPSHQSTNTITQTGGKYAHEEIQ